MASITVSTGSWTVMGSIHRKLPSSPRPRNILRVYQGIPSCSNRRSHYSHRIAGGQVRGTSILSTIAYRKFTPFPLSPLYPQNLLKQVPVTIPQNAIEIYAEIYASGNSQEEFWVCIKRVDRYAHASSPFSTSMSLTDTWETYPMAPRMGKVASERSGSL
jgi:hypothetical protein